MTPRAKKAVWIAAVGLSVAVAASVVVIWRSNPGWLGTVDEGVLIRSAQPNPRQLDRLRRDTGLATVICLRPANATAAWDQDEQRWCRQNSMRYLPIPITQTLPSDDQVRTFLAAVRAGPRPVLVHCELRRSRTGKLVAAYRIVMQNVSAGTALEIETVQLPRRASRDGRDAALAPALGDGQAAVPPAGAGAGL